MTVTNYTEYMKLFFKVFDQGKSLSPFAWGRRGEGIMKKVTNDDIGGKGSKIWYFCGDIIFEWLLG